MNSQDAPSATAEAGRARRLLPQQRAEWMAFALLLLAILGSIATAWSGSEEHHSHLIDSYYYFGAADGILSTGLPKLPWPQGPENKFFPGYSYALAIASAVSFTKPVIA